MWKVNLPTKYLRLLIALSVCFAGIAPITSVVRSQDRDYQTPLITLELVKDDPVKPNNVYRLGQKISVRVIAKNESAEQMTVPVTNIFRQNRLELWKNGKLIPYKPQIAKNLRIGEAEADMVGISRRDFIKLMPYSSATIIALSLDDWYGSLALGSYQLTNRYRLVIGGTWSADSKPIGFEVTR